MEGPKQAVHRRKPTNISEFKWFCTKEWAKNSYMLLCRTDQHLQETLPSVTAAKEGHTRYWKQRFTYFCNAQICNTGSFFSINKWQRKYFSLTCLIRFSLSTFRTYMKSDDVFGSYLCRNIENSKGSQTFKQHCIYSLLWKKVVKNTDYFSQYIYIYICICACVCIYIHIYLCKYNIIC